MDKNIHLWIKEIRRFNPILHLMGSGMISTLEQDVDHLLPLLMEIHEAEIADLGSGSGLPAIPFKIVHPETRVILIERSGKKCTFLKHMLDKLNLNGLEIKEVDPLKINIGTFDAVISRAFSPLTSLAKTVSKILKDNGTFYYLYTGNNEPELVPTFKRIELISRNPLHLGVYTIEQSKVTAA